MEYGKLLEIDDCFKMMVDNLINPLDFLSGMFLMRAHSAYRGACRLSMSGQLPGSYRGQIYLMPPASNIRVP